MERDSNMRGINVRRPLCLCLSERVNMIVISWTRLSCSCQSQQLTQSKVSDLMATLWIRSLTNSGLSKMSPHARLCLRSNSCQVHLKRLLFLDVNSYYLWKKKKSDLDNLQQGQRTDKVAQTTACQKQPSSRKTNQPWSRLEVFLTGLLTFKRMWKVGKRKQSQQTSDPYI